MTKNKPLSCLAILLLIVGVAGVLSADKLEDFGLDRNGRPLLEKMGDSESSIVFFEGNRPVHVHRDGAGPDGDLEGWARRGFSLLLAGPSSDEP